MRKSVKAQGVNPFYFSPPKKVDKINLTTTYGLFIGSMVDDA